MNRRAYIITFDRKNDGVDYVKFHNALTTAIGIISWWHYMDSTYIIIVEWGENANTISEFILKQMPNKQFLVSQLNLKDHNGWLPKEAWDWISSWMYMTV